MGKRHKNRIKIPGGQTPNRRCARCGAPSDHKSLCSRCNPKKATREHIDKYANR